MFGTFNKLGSICGRVPELVLCDRIMGDEPAMGVIPKACKDGNLGNRNLYHFCYVIIIMLDISVPLALCAIAAYTLDISNSTICAKTLFLAAKSTGSAASADPRRLTYPCCSLGVAVATFLFSLIMFVIFVTIPSVLEPGKMSYAWDQHFCNGYVSSYFSNSQFGT
jgi:hypothetical protein